MGLEERNAPRRRGRALKLAFEIAVKVIGKGGYE